jgi:hypothetical protein
LYAPRGNDHRAVLRPPHDAVACVPPCAPRLAFFEDLWCERTGGRPRCGMPPAAGELLSSPGAKVLCATRRSVLRGEAHDERRARVPLKGAIDVRQRGSRTGRSVWSIAFLSSAAAA